MKFWCRRVSDGWIGRLNWSFCTVLHCVLSRMAYGGVVGGSAAGERGNVSTVKDTLISVNKTLSRMSPLGPKGTKR